MMYDGIFFVNHALKVASEISVYNDKERYLQTLETIDSINKYCPNSKIFIFDSSPFNPNKNYIKSIIDRGVFFFYKGNNPIIKKHSLNYDRSISECMTFLSFIEWFKKHKYQYQYRAKRIYKLSGRYRLNDNFVLNDDNYDNAFVFAKTKKNIISKEDYLPRWKLHGFDKFFDLRLWHMDYKLLNDFEFELNKILDDCIKYKIEVEHSYYKNLHTYKIIELDKIGVCGNIAPSGRYIDE